jgi:hypothetical protein
MLKPAKDLQPSFLSSSCAGAKVKYVKKPLAPNKELKCWQKAFKN